MSHDTPGHGLLQTEREFEMRVPRLNLLQRLAAKPYQAWDRLPTVVFRLRRLSVWTGSSRITWSPAEVLTGRNRGHGVSQIAAGSR